MPIGRALTMIGLLTVFTSGLPSSAADDEDSRATLRGLSGVYVTVELAEHADRAGLDRGIFQTDVELKLRLAGIKVLSEQAWLQAPGNPHLYMRIITAHDSSAEDAMFTIPVEFRQSVLLQGDPSRPECHATTWSYIVFGEGGISLIREAVRQLADAFLNAWLSVNPKGGSE